MLRHTPVRPFPHLPVLKLVTQVVEQVSDLPEFFRRTGPRPLFDTFDQPRAHRVAFDISGDMLKFPVVAHPMVTGFVLPKRPPGAAKNDVCVPGTRAFDGSGYLSQRFVGLQESVNMVRRHNPDEEVAQLPLFVGREHRVDNDSGDARICQPHRTRSRTVQLSVDLCEPLSLRGRRTVRAQISGARQGAVKSPCQKDWNTFRVHSSRSETCPT
jgi:hypothetical protein